MSISILDIPKIGNRTSDGRPPSNRANHTPVSDKTIVVGVDTLRVRGRYLRHDFDVINVRSRRDPESGERTPRSTSAYQVLGDLGVSISIDDRLDKFVSFEASIPTILRGTNVVASSAIEVADAVELVYSAASEVLDWDTDCGDLEVRRCDYVRDFHDVTDIPGVLDRLAAVPQVKGRVRGIFNDPQRGHTQTCRIGTPSRWMVSAYDKGQEMLAAASRIQDPERRQEHHHRGLQAQARGHLRVEIGVRSKPLKERLHTNRLSDVLDEDLMTDTARHYFNAAGLGTRVGGTAKIIDTIRAMSKNSDDYKKIDRLLGMLFLEANGLTQVASRNTIKEHAKVADRLGLTAADFKMADLSTVHLDWQTGTLIQDEVAA